MSEDQFLTLDLDDYTDQADRHTDRQTE